MTRAAVRIFPAQAERQAALCALPSFAHVVSLLRLARQQLGGQLTAFEVMWNAYYRLTVERVNMLKRPYLKMSRTAEEIETMRTLKRALGPKNILNPGRIFAV